MDDNQDVTFINVIKLPFVFITYMLYIVISLFIPKKFVSKIINIEKIEEHINIYFNNLFYLKIIALLISIIIFIYFIS